MKVSARTGSSRSFCLSHTKQPFIRTYVSAWKMSPKNGRGKTKCEKKKKEEKGINLITRDSLLFSIIITFALIN